VDIAKIKSKPRGLVGKSILPVALVIALIMIVLYVKDSINTVELDRKDILIATVQKGELQLVIDGYGTLKSKRQQILTALTTATVQEILLKPGATVTKSSVIVILSNPELLVQADNAQQEMALARANLRQLVINQKREILDARANLAELSSRYETAKLRRIAEEKLAEKNIVSDLTLKESQLNEQQLLRRIELQEQRAEQLSLVHLEAVNIQRERIKQQQGKLDTALNRVEKLSVKANFDGVLQRLSVELGQSLTAGQQIALIGSVRELIALIQIPQSRTRDVIVGQIAVIDTRLDKIEGQVIRIDPIVDNNTVQVEISLPPRLPKSAIPEQSIDATIIIETLKNVNYIKRPANARGHTEMFLYKLNTSNSQSSRTSVLLGKESTLFIEIKKGGVEGEQFIISDLSNYKNPHIELN